MRTIIKTKTKLNVQTFDLAMEMLLSLTSESKVLNKFATE